MSNDDAIKDNIWLTAKTRMVAETRLRRYSIASHLTISYFSLLLVISSFLSQSLTSPPKQLDSISIMLAVSTLSVSLILYGFNFSAKADQFRSSYLELQRLHHNLDKYDDPGNEYFNILEKILTIHPETSNPSLCQERFLTNKNFTPAHMNTGIQKKC